MDKIMMIKLARDNARRESDHDKVLVLNDIIGAIEKETTNGKKRVTLTSEIVDGALVKYRKTLKKAMSEIPESHPLYSTYKYQLTVVETYCPKVVDNEEEIMSIILEAFGAEPLPTNKGMYMKRLSPIFKARFVDTEVAMPLIDRLIATGKEN